MIVGIGKAGNPDVMDGVQDVSYCPCDDTITTSIMQSLVGSRPTLSAVSFVCSCNFNFFFMQCVACIIVCVCAVSS